MRHTTDVDTSRQADDITYISTRLTVTKEEEKVGAEADCGEVIATSRKRALVEEADPLLQPRYSVRQTLQEVLDRIGSHGRAGTKKDGAPTVLASSGVSGRHPPGQPVIPVYVGTEKEQALIREQFLWRINDPNSNPQLAAQRLSREIGLPAPFERIVEDSINAGLKQIKASGIPADAVGSGAQHLVEIELSVKLGRTSFKDKILWDVLDPLNMPETYAHTVCEDLKLGTSMYDAINKQLHEQIEAKLKEWVEARRQGKPPSGIQLPEKRTRVSHDEVTQWTPVVTREPKKSEVVQSDGGTGNGQEMGAMPPEAIDTPITADHDGMSKKDTGHESNDEEEEEEEAVAAGREQEDRAGGDDAGSDGGVLGGADGEEEEDEEGSDEDEEEDEEEAGEVDEDVEGRATASGDEEEEDVDDEGSDEEDDAMDEDDAESD